MAEREIGHEGARLVAATVGVCVGISGLDHGFFEILQGNNATPGVFIQAIGPEQKLWVYGGEEAFTLVPNFLITGILAVAVGLAMIVWSTRFLDRRGASRGYLTLGLVMLLVGGGVGMLAFLLFGWAVARRIHRPPAWWGTALSAGPASALARSWRTLLVVALAFYGFALEIAIAGYVPAVSDPDTALSICWGALLAALLAFVLALFGSSSPGRVPAALEA